jgi:predicted phage terminase large subunit-like protein
VDDPLKSADAHSQAARENVILWWDETMSTRGNDPNKSARVIIMQRLHEQDLTGHILAKMKADAEANQYEHLCLPAEYVPTQHVTSVGWKDPRTEPGELLWPERVPQAALNRLKKDLGSYGTAGQLQQEPAPSEGGILKRHWWRFWVPKGVKLPSLTTRLADNTIFEHPQLELPETFDQMLQSWDMTFKDTKNSDFVAGQVWGKVGANKFLLDQTLERMDIVKTIAAVTSMTDKWPKATAKLVEDKANGPAVISMLRNKISGLIAIEPEGSKESRVHAVSPEIESGNVYLPHPLIAPWVNELIDRAAAFPNAAHDDDIDAMTQALRRWGGGKQPLVAVL